MARRPNRTNDEGGGADVLRPAVWQSRDDALSQPMRDAPSLPTRPTNGMRPPVPQPPVDEPVLQRPPQLPMRSQEYAAESAPTRSTWEGPPVADDPPLPSSWPPPVDETVEQYPPVPLSAWDEALPPAHPDADELVAEDPSVSASWDAPPVRALVDEPVEAPVYEPVEEPVAEPVEEPVARHRPVEELVEQYPPVPLSAWDEALPPAHPDDDELVAEDPSVSASWDAPPVRALVDEPVEAPVEEQVAEPVEEPVARHRPVEEPVEAPVEEPVEAPVAEQVEEPVAPLPVPLPVRSEPAFEESPVADPQNDGEASQSIFDEMLSEWLIDDPVELAQSTDLDWKSVWDHGWSVASAADDAPVSQHTTSGLPVRQPGARLVPGTADPAGNGHDEATNGRHRNGGAHNGDGQKGHDGGRDDRVETRRAPRPERRPVPHQHAFRRREGGTSTCNGIRRNR